MNTQLFGKDFITTEDWSRTELETALNVADDLKRRFAMGELHDHILRAKTLYMLFFEESTRTRNSFETGMTQLGGHAIWLTPAATQIGHGENAKDTGMVLGSYGHGIAVRDCRTDIGQSYQYDIAKHANVPVFSMQDDVDHPCQAMADLMTIRERFGADLRGRKFTIAWTYAPKYVRPLSVPQSLVMLMTRFGMDVTLAHPKGFELMPHTLASARAHAEESGAKFEVIDDMDAAFENADICYAKSWGPIMVTEDPEPVQKMVDEHKDWICDERRMALAKKSAIYMHCMPIDRGYEATDGVIDGPQSVIYQEAENRLHIQKALMALTMGGESEMEIKDAVVLITGGAIRLGKAHGLHLARKGAHIAFSYLPNEPGLETKAEIEALGVRCTATLLDVRDLAAMRRWVADTAEAFGRIDVLINNASPWLMRPFLEVTEAEYDLCNDVTVKAAFFCTQAVAPIMLAQGRGVIINVADLSVYEVWLGLGHHAIAKAGVVQLTRYAARELSPAIRVNAVAPGPVLLPPDFTPEQIEDARQHTLVKRLGAPEDVSRMIALLIEHDYLTGHVYFIDGGELFTH